MRLKRRTAVAFLIAVLCLTMQGCTPTASTKTVAWTYTQAQIAAGFSETSSSGSRSDYRAVDVLFAVMKGICVPAADCAAVELKGQTVGSNRSEFQNVMFTTIDRDGHQLATTPYSLPNQRFSSLVIEQLNLAIGVSQ